MSLPRYAIFDMDGTLIDSTGMWDEVSARVLARYGKTFPQEDRQRTLTLTIEGTSAFFVREYGLPVTADQIAEEIRQEAHVGYTTQVTARPGVAAALQAMAGQGITMCVASGTETALIDAALTHLGLRSHFAFITCCQNPEGKAKPDVYLQAMHRLGASAPGEVAIFEDSSVALHTAKTAGFYAVAVLDSYQKDCWPQLRREADEVCENWQTWADGHFA